MDRPFPPAHAGADDFVLQILIERSPFLPGLGVAGRGDVAHGVEDAGGVALEGESLSDRADSLAGGAEHVLGFSSAQMLLVLAVALADQFVVEVLAIDLDDCSNLGSSIS